jgi:hypothetical protein
MILNVLFLVATNFLHVNGENDSITVCFSKIVTTIIYSKKLVKMGRKICLFLHYVELIDTKLWMVKEGVTLNGGLDIWTVERRIKRGIWKQCG